MPVVAFHAGISAFSGGFIGVDVFFVISGYLISSVILADIRNNTFSLQKFYVRRVKRIFPALFAMLAATSVLACLFLMPAELTGYSKSLLSATLSFSNLYFWSSSGYFDPASDQQPLLHTWSLSVEEQFYLFFPLFLMATQKRSPKSVNLIIILLALISFIVSCRYVESNPTSAFYLPQSRAWELLLGTILALNIIPQVENKVLNDTFSMSGLLLIIYSIFSYSKLTPFPGVYALVPCIGTALIIYTGKNNSTFVSKLLSVKPMVFIGMISYSIYIWHWPLILFQKNFSMIFSGVPSAYGKAILVLLSIVLAAISWRYIEQPFRRPALQGRQSRTFVQAGTAVVLMMTFSVCAILSEGFPQRFSPKVVQMASYLNYDFSGDYRQGSCFITDDSVGFKGFQPSACLQLLHDKSNYLIIGDSFAADLWFGLSNRNPEINFLQATGSGCKPTLKQAGSTDVIQRRCAQLMSFMFHDFIEKTALDAILISGSWRVEDLRDISETLEWLKVNKPGAKLILFGAKVQYDAPLPRILATSLEKGDDTLPGRHIVKSVRELDATISQIAGSKNIQYISFFNLLCADNQCINRDGEGYPLSYDIGHLTRWGSLFVADRIKSLWAKGPVTVNNPVDISTMSEGN